MNMRKKLPLLFKTLSRTFGARRSTIMMRGIPTSAIDDNIPSKSFIWDDARQGHNYWIKVHCKVTPDNIGSAIDFKSLMISRYTSEYKIKGK